MLPTKFRFIWPNGFRGEESKKSANQKQEWPVAAMFAQRIGTKWEIFRGPSIDASYQVLGSFGKAVSEEKIFFRNKPIRTKNCLWRPCLSTDPNEMSSSYREPSIDTSYQVTVYLARQFQRRRFFRNQPTSNKNCLWWPCFLTSDRDEMSNLYRGHSIDASYQVLIHLAKWRRSKCDLLSKYA